MNTKDDIPSGTGHDVEETDLVVPELPEPWEWRSANRSGINNAKTNIFFGHSVTDVGGWLGEIDNYVHDGETKWDVHVREILDEPSNEKHGTVPAPGANTCETFDSLHEAIDSVPGHIYENYIGEPSGEDPDGTVDVATDEAIEVGDEPINGEITEREWVDQGTVVVTVVDGDETWKETYSFESAERIE